MSRLHLFGHSATMSRLWHLSQLWHVFHFLLGAVRVNAACECGFRDESGNVWMDALVLPFDKIGTFANDVNNDVWLSNYTHSQGHGNYTYTANPENVYMEDSELVLKVTKPSGNNIGSAQLSSRRKDLFYGSYRSLIQMPTQSGSCVGFFQYYNDTEEIDIEYIGVNSDMLYVSSKRTNPRDYSMDIDYLNYRYPGGTIANIYRDYRFDWFHDRVDFYLDNHLVYTASNAIPSSPSRWMLMNWANGDLNWSGLPTEDILVKIKNVRVFFNSTHPYIVKNYGELCTKSARNGNSICDVSSFSTTDRYGYQENVIRRYGTGNTGDSSGNVSPFSDSSSPSGSSCSSIPITPLLLWSLVVMVVMVGNFAI